MPRTTRRRYIPVPDILLELRRSFIGDQRAQSNAAGEDDFVEKRCKFVGRIFQQRQVHLRSRCECSY
jgi:hypothetical protein